MTPSSLLPHIDAPAPDQGQPVVRVSDVAHTDLVVAYPDETLREAADRMAEHWLGALPVVTRGQPRRLLGIVTAVPAGDGRRG